MTEQPDPLTIQGVPAYVRRSDTLPLIEHLGFDVHQVRELRIGLKSIRATLKAKNRNGHDFLDDFEPNSIAEHIITIPIVDE